MTAVLRDLPQAGTLIPSWHQLKKWKKKKILGEQRASTRCPVEGSGDMKRQGLLMKRLYLAARIVAFVALISLCLTGQTKKHQYSPREKAFYADPALVNFVRPGLVITINSASISSTGAISVTYTLTDPSGLPLDAAGVDTPGVVSLAYVASYIPKGQEQYVAYTTSQATGPVLGTITRPNFELGGTATALGSGQYQYTFRLKAPAGFDPTVTTTVGGGRQPRSYVIQSGHQLRGRNFQLRSQWRACHGHARCHCHRELQYLSRPTGVPRRLRPRNEHVRPVPPAAECRSDLRQFTRPESNGA